MTCAQAHKALLQAELRELEGKGDTPLARHLRDCPHCRDAAGVILRAEAALARALGPAVAAPDLERVLALALVPETPEVEAPWTREGTVLPLRELTKGSPSRLPAGGMALLPVAAAAALAALFLAREPRLPGPAPAPVAYAGGLDVAMPPGQNVAVLETSDPNITVLWLY